MSERPKGWTPVLSACAIVLLNAFVAGRALGQEPPTANAALIANDHYTRSHDYDLLHQRIVVSRFNWDSTSFEGSVTTRLVSRRAALDSVILDEGHLLANQRVVDQGGRTLATTRHGDTLVIRPPRALNFGDTLEFTVAYHGVVESGHGLTFITSDGLAHRPDQIWSQGEDHDNHYWFPTYDFPNDKMTWELVATVPVRDLAVSNGRLVSNVATGATRTMTWRQETPSATYLVSLVVAPLAMIHDTWDGIPVDYYTYHEDSTLALPLFHVTPDMIATYSKLTGVRYPWAKYAQTTVADFFGGMENVSATTLVDWLPDAKAYVDRPWYQHILIPHELAHQWFGDYVTTVNWANMWLNEGFAEFMPGQYWGTKRDRHAEEDYYLDEYRQYLDIEQRASMPLASMGSNNIYPKGALVLEMLKNYLGPEAFWASVHEYLTSHAFGNASSDDLRQAVLTATGRNLDWFWDEWVYSAGHPAFSVTASYDSVNARLAVTVTQTQVDSFKPDSTGRLFHVPPVFRMPVAIRARFGSAGERIVHGEINARQQTFTIDGIRGSAPTMVIFDDGNTILKSLTFEQPVAWLAEQLRQDGNLWNRTWVIEQLGRHASDPAAIAALADAANHADYYLTRATAVEALAGVAAAAGADALTAAARDTSAAVRAAAFRAMARAGTPGAAALARAAYAGDPSYEVRAAALGTLAHVDPAHAHDAIAQGVVTPSYRDVIQGAALEAVIATGDTTMIAAVDSAMASQELAAHVLAFLGGRGNAHALDALTAHLNDRRAAVRRWTVSAFENTMMRVNRTVALERLRAAVNTITFADTRRQVGDLLAASSRP